MAAIPGDKLYKQELYFGNKEKKGRLKLDGGYMVTWWMIKKIVSGAGVSIS